MSSAGWFIDALILENEGLVRRVLKYFRRNQRILLDRDDVEGIVRLRLVETARMFENLDNGVTFEGFAWKYLVGAVLEAESVERREAQKMFWAAAQVNRTHPFIDLEEAMDDGDPLVDFLEQAATAATLGLLSEATMTASFSTEEDTLLRYVREALEGLPFRMRRVIMQNVVEQVPMADVCAGLGISEPTGWRDQKAGLAQLARLFTYEPPRELA